MRKNISSPPQYASFVLLALALIWEATSVWHYKCPHITDYDGGWAVALGWFHEHHLSIGKDVIFTYGPLGWIYSLEVGALMNDWTAWLGCALRLAILWSALQISGIDNDRKALALLWIGIINRIYYSCDVEAMLILGCCALAFIQPQPQPRSNKNKNEGKELVAATLATILALVKFTWLVAAGGVLAIPFLISIKERKLPLTIIGGVMCGEVISWVLNLKINFGWSYIFWGIEVAKGFKDNMNLPQSHQWVPLETGVLLIVAFALWWKWYGWRSLSILPICLLVYQAATTRADWPHEKTGLLVAGSLILLGSWKRISTLLLPLLCLGIVCIQILTKEHLPYERGLIEPPTQKDTTFEGYTVDILGDFQSLLAYAEMDYTPRPSFQLFGSYTAKIAERNLQFYREHPPEYVLMALSPIDGHLASSEDPLCIAEVLQKWDYTGQWLQFLIFKKANHPTEETTQKGVGAGGHLPNIKVNETVMLKIPEATNWMKSNHLSILGLKCYYSDGTYSLYRLCPGNAEAGFIISPRINSNKDVVALKEAGKQVNCTAWSILIPKSKNNTNGGKRLTDMPPLNFEITSFKQPQKK